MYSEGNMLCDNSYFKNNFAYYGGVFIRSGGFTQFKGTNFTGNKAIRSGIGDKTFSFITSQSRYFLFREQHSLLKSFQNYSIVVESGNIQENGFLPSEKEDCLEKIKIITSNNQDFYRAFIQQQNTSDGKMAL